MYFFLLFGRDFNGDGHLDIFVITATDFTSDKPRGVTTKNTLHLNDGTGNFQASPLVGVITEGTPFMSFSEFYEQTGYHNIESMGIVTGDFDGDGDIDVFIVTKRAPVNNLLLINDGFGNFTEVEGGDATKALTSAQAVVSCDIDGDGDLDIYIRGRPNVLLLNDGTGNFTQAGNDVVGDIQSEDEPWLPPLCFDATGNGQMDLWASRKSLNLNKGNWPHTEAETGNAVQAFSTETRFAHVLDADNDGDMVRSIIRHQAAITFY